jgi:hypothetical protein
MILIKKHTDLLEEIQNAQNLLKELLENDKRHLADVGCILSRVSKLTDKAADKAFKYHYENDTGRNTIAPIRPKACILGG